MLSTFSAVSTFLAILYETGNKPTGAGASGMSKHSTLWVIAAAISIPESRGVDMRPLHYFQ